MRRITRITTVGIASAALALSVTACGGKSSSDAGSDSGGAEIPPRRPHRVHALPGPCYRMFMPKQAVSVTLEDDNILWLRGRTRAGGRRSLSDLLDAIVTEARLGGRGPGESRSVVGTVDIAASDPDLTGADEEIAGLFARSLAQPLLVREDRSAYSTAAPSAARRKTRRRG